MNAHCTDNGGFEDLLTPGAIYPVKEYQGNSVLIVTDNGAERWLGLSGKLVLRAG